MTRDELTKCLRALIAVIELHKPFAVDNNEGLFCDKCLPDSYPCDTIQAIGKELK